MPTRIRLAGGQLSAGPAPRTYRAVLIRPGEWKGKRLHCSAEVLQRSAAKFEGVSSFLNPPPPAPGQHGYPGLEHLLGVIENAAWDAAEQAIVADYRLADTEAARSLAQLIDGWLAARQAGHTVPDIGLSAVPWLHAGPPGPDGVREVLEIVGVEQVDAVYRPAAGGEFIRVLNSLNTEEEGMDEVLNHEAAKVSEGATLLPKAREGREAHAEHPERSAAESKDAGEVHAMLSVLKESVLEARLATSGLPGAFQRVVREGLPAEWSTGELDAAIARVRNAWAEEEGKRTVQGVRPVLGSALGANGSISGMQDGLDQITEAAEALVEGRTPARGVRPLSGPRELYLLLSGDYEMTGVFRGERVYLANVNSTTMANIVANALNKVVVREFTNYPRWWEPVVRRETFSTLNTIKWVTVGGIGELPTVAEGGAYTELTWTDVAQSTPWQKRGGYLGLTLEALDKDDTAMLRSVPAALAQAAWLTLGKSISNIFTYNGGAGPLLADGTALFDATRGNVGTTALSSAGWIAARTAMRKQEELNSGERLGALTTPRYLLVPPDLENAALTVLGSEGVPGSANNDANSEAYGGTHDARMDAARRRVIVVDLWTDANNWAAVADPRLYPTIGLGFRYGETPEIFSVASPTNGLMFTNDVMPVKVRWFYAAGAMDYRGLYKANVA